MKVSKIIKMRQLFVLLLVTICVGQSIYAQQLYIVDEYSVDESKITEGESFVLTLKLSAIKSVTGRELTLINTSSDVFSFKSSGSSKPIDNVKDKMTIELPLIYQGGSKKFSFNIIDNATSEVVAIDSIVINEVKNKKDDDDTSEPFDSTKVTPSLMLSNQPFKRTLSSNKPNKISVDLKNASNYTAKNVEVTITTSQGKLPIDMHASRIPTALQDIPAKKNKSFTFDLIVDKTAVAKTYDAVLNIKYENSYGDKFTKEIPVYIAIENFNSSPLVTVVDTTLEGGKLSSSEPKKMSVTLSNVGTLNANNINVQLTGFTPETVTLAKGADSATIPAMSNGQTKKIDFNVIASPKAIGVQMLTVNIKYTDQNGVDYQKEAPIYLNTDKQAGGSVLDVSLSGHQFNIISGQVFDVTATVKNPTENDLQNVVVKLESDGSLAFLSTDTHIIKEFKPGETKHFTFKLTVGDEGAGSINSLKLVATASNVEGALASTDRAGVIVAKLKDEDKKGVVSIPKPIIEHYTYGGDYVYAGSTFPLTIDVKNTHSGMAIKNVKLTFSSDDNVIIPVNASNAIFIPYIGAGDVAQARINLTSKNDAEQKIYSLNFKMTYEDEKGNAYDQKDNAYVTEEAITINLKQENKLEIAELYVPETNSVGVKIPLEVGFFNTGKSTLYNLLVKAEGDFDVIDGTYYVGNFEPGASNYFSASIVPLKTGDLTGKLIFTFEDADGMPAEETREIAFYAEEMMVDEGFGEDGEIPMDGELGNFDENGNPIGSQEVGGIVGTLKQWWWIPASFIAIVGGVLFIRRRRQKKEQALLDVLMEAETESISSADDADLDKDE